MNYLRGSALQWLSYDAGSYEITDGSAVEEGGSMPAKFDAARIEIYVILGAAATNYSSDSDDHDCFCAVVIAAVALASFKLV